MQRISLDDNIKLKNTIVTIGKFDGIHKGHEKLLEVIVNNANGRQKVVLTFETTPSAFLKNNANKTIVTEDEKQILCEQQGVDVYMKMPMKKEFLALSPDEFVSKILKDKIGATTIVCGPDFHFGTKASGNVKFLKDNLTTTANFKIVKGKDKKKYGVITLSKYAIRYATDRFLDVEIVETPVSGLKVPKSSVVTSKLYVIPKEYSKKGENGNSIGFNLQNSKTNKSEIYYPPIAYSDDDNYYVAQSYFEPGDVITKSDSHSSYVVERTRDFMGVYNINNGYTVFTIVNILDTLDEYYIVANETSGLEIYDRIVLDASKVSENQIIFQ